MHLAQIKAIISDMDGVLWRQSTPLPGLNDFFDFLHAHDIGYMLATNNSARTVAEYVEKLAGFGIQTPPERIVTSGVATALYLQERQPGARVYAVGMPGLERTLAEYGFTLADEDVDFVVAGIDWTLTYDKIATANRLIRQGAAFIGTNPDRTFPSPNGPMPGAGTVLASIQTPSYTEPVVIGKPSPLMFELALKRLNVQPAEAAMLGDRLETDIAGGADAGMKTIMVCTGIHTRADLPGSPFQPDAVFDDLPALLEAWRAALAAP
jgi:4-nitrophenyl phosphatase